jgi:hypothetical protein
MFHRLITTERDWATTVVRTVPGVVVLAPGAHELLAASSRGRLLSCSRAAGALRLAEVA